MDEFDLISRLFAPIATTHGAAGLLDDVAELTTPGRMIATADAIVEGVHFLRTDPLETVARKLVRVNVSDILAKGGEPSEALLSLVWPWRRDPEELRPFAEALGDDLATWGAHLVGGDTTSTSGPLVLSLTLTGRCGPDGPVRRNGGRPGDDLWVTGTIGDGWLGLLCVQDGLAAASETDRDWLAYRYRLPALAGAGIAGLVSELATASIDVSDGLLADAGHIASASGVAAVIEAGRIPLSEAAQRWLATQPDGGLVLLASGGDDYQVLFGAPASSRARVEQAAAAAGIKASRIGRLEAGSGVHILDAAGNELPRGKSGWRHFRDQT